MSLYQFVGGRPLSWVDPLGLQAKPDPLLVFWQDRRQLFLDAREGAKKAEQSVARLRREMDQLRKDLKNNKISRQQFKDRFGKLQEPLARKVSLLKSNRAIMDNTFSIALLANWMIQEGLKIPVVRKKTIAIKNRDPFEDMGDDLNKILTGYSPTELMMWLLNNLGSNTNPFKTGGVLYGLGYGALLKAIIESCDNCVAKNYHDIDEPEDLYKGVTDKWKFMTEGDKSKPYPCE